MEKTTKTTKTKINPMELIYLLSLVWVIIWAATGLTEVLIQIFGVPHLAVGSGLFYLAYLIALSPVLTAVTYIAFTRYRSLKTTKKIVAIATHALIVYGTYGVILYLTELLVASIF